MSTYKQPRPGKVAKHFGATPSEPGAHDVPAEPDPNRRVRADAWYRQRAYRYIDDHVMEACRNAGSTHFSAAVDTVEKMLRETGQRMAEEEMTELRKHIYDLETRLARVYQDV